MTNIIDGIYTIRVIEDSIIDRVIEIPMVITSRENVLYDACSPKNPWFSSLTFVRGEPLLVDPHGAEDTLAGYVDLGTSVAFIPQTCDLNPPWHAREFIHSTFLENDFVPQPPYAHERIYATLLKDAVDVVLYTLGCNKDGSYCGFKYNNVYVDDDFSSEITKPDVDRIQRFWGTNPFIVRRK